MANTWDTLVRNLVQKKKLTLTTEVNTGVTYVTPVVFELGDSYNEGDLVTYHHTSGVIQGITIPYLLEAKTDLPSYNTFDLLDWKIVWNYTWNIDRAVGMSEKYDIFPGDKIILNGEGNDANNPHATIRTSDLLITEFAKIRYRQIGTGVNSVQTSNGINYFVVEMPIPFDNQAYGLIDNSLFNGQALINILFDNIADNFEAYFKLIVKGNPLVRTTYPELTDYFTIIFGFNDLSVLELSDYSSFNYLGFPVFKPSFTNDNDFVFYKFYKTSTLSKVRFQQLPINTLPDIF